MSGTAIRGQEAQVRVTVNDDLAAAFGLYGLLPLLNINDWTITPRTELVERDYIGENQTSLDQQHNGYDANLSGDETNATVLAVQDLIQFKSENNLAPPRFTVAITSVYRDSVTLPRTEQLLNCVIKVGERSGPGRTEYIGWTLEIKARNKKTIIG